MLFLGRAGRTALGEERVDELHRLEGVVADALDAEARHLYTRAHTHMTTREAETSRLARTRARGFGCAESPAESEGR